MLLKTAWLPPEEHVMTAPDRQAGNVHAQRRFGGVFGLLIGVVLLVGRGAVSRSVADLAQVGPDDRVLDVGCGPGGAARQAARRGAAVTGVDPAPLMLAMGRWLSRGRSGRGIRFVTGTAEALPVADQSVTVAWAISSAHHWADVAVGLGELHRVLKPGGRLLIAERLTRPGARGMAAHGFTAAQAAETVTALQAAGFADATHQTSRAGRRVLAIVSAHRSESER
jgi:ubiquinone/menaquinone biosynthesis C-methylase UbiE